MLLEVGTRAESLFDAHTRFVFPSLRAFREFHRELVLQSLTKYHDAAHRPAVLILKDPLLTQSLSAVRLALPEVEIVLVIRHPADVLASQIVVNRRLGRQLDLEELVCRHNLTLDHLRAHWDVLRPTVISYQQLRTSKLAEVWHRLRLTPGDVSKLWSSGMKKYPEDAQGAFVTPLYGKPPMPRNSGRHSLPVDVRKAINGSCLPLCREILRKAGQEVTNYWYKG
jgi:hypothetical protein